MVWTTPATPVTLTTITVAFYNVNIRDNLNQLRANTGSGDPGAAGKVLVSDTAASAAWLAAGATGTVPVITGGTPVYTAQSALSVGHATSADSATTATSANTASTATNATNATNATTANSATTAGSATTAATASNALLLNNENWKAGVDVVQTPARTVNTTPTSDAGLTIPATGKYTLMVKGRWNLTVGDAGTGTDIYKNGVLVAGGNTAVEGVAMPNVSAITWRTGVSCTAGDTIQAMSYKTSGGGTSSIQGVLLSAKWEAP